MTPFRVLLALLMAGIVTGCLTGSALETPPHYDVYEHQYPREEDRWAWVHVGRVTLAEEVRILDETFAKREVVATRYVPFAGALLVVRSGQTGKTFTGYSISRFTLPSSFDETESRHENQEIITTQRRPEPRSGYAMTNRFQIMRILRRAGADLYPGEVGEFPTEHQRSSAPKP